VRIVVVKGRVVSTSTHRADPGAAEIVIAPGDSGTEA
jgi:hypothetical protein